MGFCCLLKTRVQEENFAYVSSRSGDSWGYFCSYSSSGVGRIWMMWKRSRTTTKLAILDAFYLSSICLLNSFQCVK